MSLILFLGFLQNYKCGKITDHGVVDTVLKILFQGKLTYMYKVQKPPSLGETFQTWLIRKIPVGDPWLAFRVYCFFWLSFSLQKLGQSILLNFACAWILALVLLLLFFILAFSYPSPQIFALFNWLVWWKLSFIKKRWSYFQFQVCFCGRLCGL